LKEMAEAGLQSYIIRGGEGGRARLGVLAEVMARYTGQLLDRLGSLRGFSVIDAGCGGGDVSFDLAERVGADGKVDALDPGRGEAEPGARRS
jgi:2-polyprenyl-3-methyl-5-hydroxy-6-metoxy-1,4-benzoquinol methylase